MVSEKSDKVESEEPAANDAAPEGEPKVESNVESEEPAANDAAPEGEPKVESNVEPNVEPAESGEPAANDAAPEGEPKVESNVEPNVEPAESGEPAANDAAPEGEPKVESNVEPNVEPAESESSGGKGRFPPLEKEPARSKGKGMYAALLATVGAAAFFAGLSVPVLNQDPVTMSDLDQALLFLEDKIDNLSDDLQNLEDTMLTDPEAATTQPQPTVTADDDPVLGNPDAPITMIEFSDFQCPFCARFYSETLPLIKSNFIDTGVVKLVYRDFPLQNIHPNAIPAAVASECAHETGHLLGVSRYTL